MDFIFFGRRVKAKSRFNIENFRELSKLLLLFHWYIHHSVANCFTIINSLQNMDLLHPLKRIEEDFDCEMINKIFYGKNSIKTRKA